MTIAALIHDLGIWSHTLEVFAQILAAVGHVLTLLQLGGIL